MTLSCVRLDTFIPTLDNHWMWVIQGTDVCLDKGFLATEFACESL